MLWWFTFLWEVLNNTSATHALDKGLSNRGVGQTHSWYIMTIDCNAPAFLTTDENLRLAQQEAI